MIMGVARVAQAGRLCRMESQAGSLGCFTELSRDKEFVANGEVDIAQADFAQRQRHEWELEAIEFLQVRFENAVGERGDGAIASAIEAGDRGDEFVIEIELSSDSDRGV